MNMPSKPFEVTLGTRVSTTYLRHFLFLRSTRQEPILVLVYEYSALLESFKVGALLADLADRHVSDGAGILIFKAFKARMICGIEDKEVSSRRRASRPFVLVKADV